MYGEFAGVSGEVYDLTTYVSLYAIDGLKFVCDKHRYSGSSSRRDYGLWIIARLLHRSITITNSAHTAGCLAFRCLPPEQLQLRLARIARTSLRLDAKSIHNIHVHRFCPRQFLLPPVILRRIEVKVEIGDWICSPQGGRVPAVHTPHAPLDTTGVTPCR